MRMTGKVIKKYTFFYRAVIGYYPVIQHTVRTSIHDTTIYPVIVPEKRKKRPLRKHCAFNIPHTTVEIKTYFCDCGKEIFLGNSRAVLPDRKHSGFHADCP
jgi:hypothetical protein